jgi:modulator of FtsH protease HflC
MNNVLLKNLGTVLLGVIVALLLFSFSAFTVDQREYALVFRLGEIVSVKKEPGLYLKVPLVDNVRYFDNRILTLNSADPDRFITSEKKNVLVDSFVKWRIVNPTKFYIAVKGDELQAERRLSQTVNDGLRAEFGKRTINDVVSGERGKIMEILRVRADRDSRQMGIEVLDVRLKRNAPRAKAMLKPPRFMRAPMARVPSSTLSIAAWKPIAIASRARAMCWYWSPVPNSSNICVMPTDEKIKLTQVNKG